MKNASAVFSLLSGLGGVTRFSGHKLHHKETVLEHTGAVAIIALLLAMRINTLAPGTLNTGLVLASAIAHDWDESITGDIPRPTKYYSKELRAQFGHVERAGIANLSEALGFPDLPTLHADAKGKSPEGFVVALADIIGAVHRIWEEVLVFNNHSLVHTAKNVRDGLVDVMVRGEIMPEAARPMLYGLQNELAYMLRQAEKINTKIVELHSAHRDN